MSASAAKRRAKSLYLRNLVDYRLRKFCEAVNPEVVEASREFHLRHWLELARQLVQREHREAFYRGLQPNLENLVVEHPGDDFPPELQRAILDDLAFMEGHLQAYRELMQLLNEAQTRNDPK
jgi:hypothetical protein